MTRLYIKGGTWKNSEDEILKAGVMKYGKNQWARIASLLNRKSAKQCKARWNEWLDPSIKKTEWTREEEEKLLHLAKIMPTQWRTIAPMVGRTASQCLEHYERLLDQAQERDKDYDPNDDPRKLRPGEIDPSPETKPAKPDTVHMDEDEKEMLSEARARLANTKGKKEKRKARERQLEEARRIATIQKRRELKAAGVHLAPSRYRQKKKSAKRNENSMNPNAEIPFFRPPPPGFFDTTEEILKSKEEEQKINKEALLAFEANRDAREQKEKEAEEQKNEKKKKKKSLVLPKPAVNLFEQTTVKRSKLTLPKPQISDVELEEIGKLSSHATPVFGSGSATDKLLTPKPNAGVTPGGTTPYRSTGLKLNNVEVSNARAQEFYKKQLLEKLQTIPAPLTNATFQSAPINYEKEDELMKDITEDDLGEIKRKKAEQIKERRVLKLKRRSQPVQRNLPRPSKFDPTFKSKVVGTTDPTAEDLISKEMQLLLTHDAEKYPIEGISKKGRKSSINLEKIANNIMQQAREILEIEKTKFKSPSVEQYSQIWEKSVQVILPSDTSVLHQVYAEERQKSQKQEQKLTIFTGGYMKRLQSLTEEIKKVSQEIAERTRERNSFAAMQELEHNAIRSREGKLSEDLYQLRLEQQKLQQNYQELVQEKQQLENSLKLNVSVQNPQN